MRREKMSRIFVSALAAVFLFPSLAFANMGIPFIFFTMPAMVTALVPIVAIETFVCGCG